MALAARRSALVGVLTAVLVPVLLVTTPGVAWAGSETALANPANAWILSDLVDIAGVANTADSTVDLTREGFDSMMGDNSVARQTPTTVLPKKSSTGWTTKGSAGKVGRLLNLGGTVYDALSFLDIGGFGGSKVEPPPTFDPGVQTGTCNADGGFDRCAMGSVPGVGEFITLQFKSEPEYVRARETGYKIRLSVPIVGQLPGASYALMLHCAPGQVAGDRWMNIFIQGSFQGTDLDFSFTPAGYGPCPRIDGLGIIGDGETGLTDASGAAGGDLAVPATWPGPRLRTTLPESGVAPSTAIVDLECTAPGGVTHTVHVEGPPTVVRGALDMPAADCPDGEAATAITQRVKSGTGTVEVLPRTSAPPELRSIPRQCLLSAGPACKLDLEKAANPDAATDAEKKWQSCFIDPAACLDFPAASPTVKSKQYRCLYGGSPVPMKRCSPYRPRVDPARITVPVNIVNPSPVPGGGSAEPAGRDCFPGGWSAFNPVEWVLKPIKCAFIPKPDALDEASSTVASGWQSSKLPQWGSALGDVGSSVSKIGDGASGCSGPRFVLPLGGRSYSFNPLDACDSPMKQAAVVVKLFFSLGVVILGIRLCVRPVLASFGMSGAVK